MKGVSNMVVLCTKDGYENNTGKQYCVKGKIYSGDRGQNGAFTYEDDFGIKREALIDNENFVEVTDKKFVMIDGNDVVLVNAPSCLKAIERMNFDGNFEDYFGDGFKIYRVIGEFLSDERYISYDEK